jgi:type VI secretion system protein ImpH
MAAEVGTKDSGLNDSPLMRALLDDGCSFDFFQAVILLQLLRHNLRPVGQFSNPNEEAVQFRANSRLAFPASQIQTIDWPAELPPTMVVNFMGLTGPMGVLPYSYCELLLERVSAKDTSLQSFFGIFDHRLISLFFRAWQKYRFPVTYHAGEEDWFTSHLLDLIGLGTRGLQDRQAFPDEGSLHYVGLIGLQPRSALALEQIIADYFEVQVELDQFTGSWYALETATQCCIGDKDNSSQELGTGAVVGNEVWDRQSKVRIKLGPLSFSRYAEFLPDGGSYESLKALTRFFSNDEIDFELQLILDRDDTPCCEIDLNANEPPRLGWTTWLKSAPLQHHAGDTVLKL